MLRFGSVFFVLFSILLVYGEVTIGVNMEINVFDYIVDIKYSYFTFNILFVVFFTVLFQYCLVGLFHLKLSGFYAINPNNQTDGNSLFHLTLFICRVGFPLCLNFLSFFKRHLNTALEEVLI